MKFIVVFLLSCCAVLANGGGYHYGVKFTGAIAPFTSEGTEQVQILDEKLDIQLHAEHAVVNVRYIMQNVSGKKAKVKFGFPVEQVVNQWDFQPVEELEKKAALRGQKLSHYCRDYSIQKDGKKLAASYLSEPFSQGKVKKFEGSDVLEGIEGWMVSSMKLKVDEKTIVEISYVSDYDLAAYYVSDDGGTGPWLFRYRLSSGGVWAGPIKSGRVTVSIHGDTCDPMGVRVTQPVNVFKKQGDSWVWEFKDLEPTLANDLNIVARPLISRHAQHNLEEFGSYVTVDEKWYVEDARYTVKASSTLAPQGNYLYKAESVKPYSDREIYGDAWAEGVDGDGIGEKLILTLDKPRKLAALCVLNGYNTNIEKRFTTNNRVKDCTLIVNGKTKIKGKLYDHKQEQWISLKGYKGKVRQIELVIDSVYPGSKYKDTCLSRITLIERLTKEPKNYGAR